MQQQIDGYVACFHRLINAKGEDHPVTCHPQAAIELHVQGQIMRSLVIFKIAFFNVAVVLEFLDVYSIFLQPLDGTYDAGAHQSSLNYNS